MTEERKSLNQLIEVRIEKLKKILEKGIDPYPSTFKPNHFSKDILAKFKKFEGKTVVVAGRITSIRKWEKHLSFTFKTLLVKFRSL